VKTLRIKGRAHKFGDDINTDEIIPAKYLVTTNPKELARHCLEGQGKNFAKRVKPGDIIVAGKNLLRPAERARTALDERRGKECGGNEAYY